MFEQLRERSCTPLKVIQKNISLEEALSPLWKLTCRGGILLDWCRPVKQSRPTFVLRCLVIALIFISMSCVTLFELVQLAIAITRMTSIHSIITNLIWFCTLPLSILTMLTYLMNRKEYLTFFRDWAKLEAEMLAVQRYRIICKTKALHTAMYITYLILALISLLTVALDIFDNPGESHLLNDYPMLTNIVGPQVLLGTHLITIVYMWIFLSMTDFVPSFVFYHQGLALCRLEKDLTAVFEQLEAQQQNESNLIISCTPIVDKVDDKECFGLAVRHIWSRFEGLAVMVKRANHLFGHLIVAGHGVTLFMVCILLYSILYNLKNYADHEAALISFTANLVSFAVRLVSCALITSKLHSKAIVLREGLAQSLNRHWDQIPIEDRNVLIAFLGRIQQDSVVVASPLGLYNITASILLSILGLIVSYVIVLLQSK